MKKILLVTLKESFELSYPNHLHGTIMFIYPHLKIKTVKRIDGKYFNTVIVEELLTTNTKE